MCRPRFLKLCLTFRFAAFAAVGCSLPVSVYMKKALKILAAHPKGIRAKQFAEEWFGRDDVIWTRVRNGVSGAGAWLWAGSYLGKLKKRGFVTTMRDVRLFVLTPAGRAIISD